MGEGTAQVKKRKIRRKRLKETHPRVAAQRKAEELRAVSSAPAQKAINLDRELPAFVQRLPQMSMADLGKIWRNVINRPPGPDTGGAKRAILAIEEEWARRGANLTSLDEYFAWPSTDAPGGDGELQLSGLPKEGMLGYLDYQVGRTNGQSPPVRRAILKRVFEGTLPPVFPRPYMMEWGLPKSAHRLRKAAETIAALARLFKRRHDARYDDAISDWEADLKFLYEEYYVGRFGFGWPSTRV